MGAAAENESSTLSSQVNSTEATLEELQAAEVRARRKYRKLDKRFKDLRATQASKTAEMIKYREIRFRYETKAKALGSEAAAHEKLAQGLSEKYEVAAAASKVFSEAYEHAGCGVLPHEVADREAKQQKLGKAQRDAEQA